MTTATATAANFFTSSPSTRPYERSNSPIRIPSGFKKGVLGYGFQLLRVRCASRSCKATSEFESESGSSDVNASLLSPLSIGSSSSSSSLVVEDNRFSSAYKWCAVLGGIGFLETAYLTLLKITDMHAFCPMGGDSCSAVLTSDYSSVFGAPLPLFGMLAYGLVAVLGIQLQSGSKNAFGIEKVDTEMILTGTTTSMAVGSAYLLYILSTEFGGESCIYCSASATLSFSLLVITWKNFGLDKMREMLGSKLCIATLLFIALSTSYYAIQPVSFSLAETELPYVKTEITKESSPLALSLARHLQSIGAKLYGAFWCSHCVDQKQMFGREAAKLLDYVECYPDGVREGTTMASACSAVELKGFPSWEINGKVYSGRKQLTELARLSGIKLDDSSQN